MDALTVACLEVGDYLGRGREYVDKLAAGCERHLPPHRFVCISDREHAVETVPAVDSLAGWWAKVQLFKPGLFTGPTLYLDLDVVIEGDLHGLPALLERGDFWALDDFAWPLTRADETLRVLRTEYPPSQREELLRLIGGPGTCNSSVMLWQYEAGRDIWDDYSLARIAGLHGDQNWITQVMGERLNLIPPGWARSFRFGGRGPICVYHGEPKPHAINPPHWRLNTDDALDTQRSTH